MLTVLATLGVEYATGVLVTIWLLAADRPWLTTRWPDKSPPRRLYEITVGLCVNGLLWPVLVIRAVRDAF